MPGPFPVRLRGVDTAGHVFQTHTLADDLSQGGLYLQLPYAIAPGTRLFILTQLASGATVATRGRVLRTDAKPHGLSGIAVHFSRARLLPGLTA